MSNSNIALSQRENYSPTNLTKFLWWLSTAEYELVEESIVDRNRFKIIGTTVFATWMFATFAWTYFFSTVIQNFLVFIPLGIFMGFVILTIDRALIKGISKTNKNRFLPLLLRGLLALTIGVFMAQPALLFMFNKEIRLQTSIDNEAKRKQKSDYLNLLYKTRKDEINATLINIQNGLDSKNQEVISARNNYINEADGSGGTGKIGIKKIAIAKKAEYDKLSEELRTFQLEAGPKIEIANKQLQEINDNISKDELLFANNFNDGFLTRIEALNNLIKSNSALAFRYYLLVTILMLIELMPVIAKTLLPSNLYEEKVRLREELDLYILRKNIDKERMLKEYYSNAANEFDKESIDLFFATIKATKGDKIKSFTDDWVNDKDEEVDKLWSKMKRSVITKSDN